MTKWERAWDALKSREWGLFCDAQGWGVKGVQFLQPGTARIETFRTRGPDPVDLVLAADQWLREKRGL